MLDVHPSMIISERLKCLCNSYGIPLSECAHQWSVKEEADGYQVKMTVRLPSGRCRKFFFQRRVFKRVQLAKLYVADLAIKSGVLEFIDSEKPVRRRRTAKPKKPSPSFDSCPDFIPLESDSESEYVSDPDLSSGHGLDVNPSSSVSSIANPGKHGKPRLFRYFNYGESNSGGSSVKRQEVVSK